MKIYGNIPYQVGPIEGPRFRTSKDGLEIGEHGGGHDEVELSESVRELTKAQELIQAAPDMRMDRIAKLKDAIGKGTYHVAGREVARKMLEELPFEPPAL